MEDQTYIFRISDKNNKVYTIPAKGKNKAEARDAANDIFIETHPDKLPAYFLE